MVCSRVKNPSSPPSVKIALPKLVIQLNHNVGSTYSLQGNMPQATVEGKVAIKMNKIFHISLPEKNKDAGYI